MPFLGRKGKATEHSAAIHSVLSASRGLDWGTDEYRPSNSIAELDRSDLPRS
jgi:hypothetical protein